MTSKNHKQVSKNYFITTKQDALIIMSTYLHDQIIHRLMQVNITCSHTQPAPCCQMCHIAQDRGS